MRFAIVTTSFLACLTAEAWMPNARTRGSMRVRESFLTMANNLVLMPSSETETPNAFDSFKIGTPRVHRYRGDVDAESETNYVMWYHGRSKEMNDDEEKKLPPLSTGRIGRAISRNGLIWEKDRQGSASEDMEGVSVGLNIESWWGFDTAHVGLGNVLMPMSTPAVLAEGGVYIMYFMGGNYEESKVSDFVDGDLPESMKEATIKGIKMKIGVAVSQDGITWGRVEGDDPSGACVVPHDNSDPNADRSLPPTFPEELYCGWPEVVVNVNGPSDEVFVMYYSTTLKESRKKCIMRAVSPDGFRWTKAGVCLEPDLDLEGEAAGVARCAVVQNASYDEAANSWSSKKGWTMYYEGVSAADNKHRIYAAESTDGKKWKRVGLVLDIGQEASSEAAWDNGGVGSPHLIRLDDGTTRMYYTGQGPNGQTAFGVASFGPGTNGEWIREQAGLALPKW